MEPRKRARNVGEEGQANEAAAPLSSSSSSSSSSSASSSAPPFRGPAADSALGERLIDVIGIVAAMGFACEVSHCLYLCGETYRKGDKGETNDMIARSLQRQCGAEAARAAKRDKHGMTQLMRAALENDLPLVLQLVQLGARLELRDKFGFTALVEACILGHELIVKALLDGKYEGRGAVVGAVNGTGWTPLMFACFHGHEGVVRLLLTRGAKVAACNTGGFTALGYATQRGRAACAALLRAHGATE